MNDNDPEEGKRRRDEGMQRADDHASEEWKARADEAMYQLCLGNSLFRTEQVWADGLDKPREPRALGPVVLRAVKEGWCEPTDMYVLSRQASRHATPVRLYRSRIYRGV